MPMTIGIQNERQGISI